MGRCRRRGRGAPRTFPALRERTNGRPHTQPWWDGKARLRKSRAKLSIFFRARPRRRIAGRRWQTCAGADAGPPQTAQCPPPEVSARWPPGRRHTTGRQAAKNICGLIADSPAAPEGCLRYANRKEMIQGKYVKCGLRLLPLDETTSTEETQ